MSECQWEEECLVWDLVRGLWDPTSMVCLLAILAKALLKVTQEWDLVRGQWGLTNMVCLLVILAKVLPKVTLAWDLVLDPWDPTNMACLQDTPAKVQVNNTRCLVHQEVLPSLNRT